MTDIQPDADIVAENGSESPPLDETGHCGITTPETSETASETQPDMFPREYVETLRKESAGYRDRAKTGELRADEYAKRLHQAMVKASGKLADPSDLPFNADHLEDADALNAAIDELLAAKPHLKSRVPRGDVGQGQRDSAPAEVNLMNLISGR